MTRGSTLSGTVLGRALLLGAMLLSGCGYDPDTSPRADAQSPRSVPPPGSFTVHMNGEVNSSVGTYR
jgi:hypothetical protein